MSNDLLLSREEVLGGLPARRAATTLFLIESRTAHLVERDRHAIAPYRTEEVENERDLEFVEAFALGREPPLRPTIQDLERFAPQWADLVPNNPRVASAVAHALGEKCEFTAADVPQIRDALGVDSAPVQLAYERLYREPIETIYTEQMSPRARMRWARRAVVGWLESLPPFWAAFALTLTETVGAGVLALPIALAGVGPLPGIIMLVVFGLVNVVTVAWLAETASRTASIRYGGAYFGRMVTQYLGTTGAFLLTFALVIIAVTMLVAYAIGFATTLASATGLAAAVWVVVLFAVVAYMITRDSISSTVASALAIGAVNMVLVTILALLGLFHVSSANLSHVQVPGLGGTPFELGFLGLIFGVILSSYFGHTSVGNCAAVVLQRDPSGRALIWGVVAAQGGAVAIYSIWVLGVNGAIAHNVLTGEAGTALEPLADVAGPAVRIVGSVFVVLAMGMGSIHMATGLVNAVRERLPKRIHPVVLLNRGSGRLIFVPRGQSDGGGPRIVLTYLGQEGDRPILRAQAQAAGRVERIDTTPNGIWSIPASFVGVPADAFDKLELTVDVIVADSDQIRLQVNSNMDMTCEGDWVTPGMDLTTLLDIENGSEPADPESSLLRWMLRQGRVTASDAAAWAGQDERTMQERLQVLVERGAVRVETSDGTASYRASVARRRARQGSSLLDRVAMTEGQGTQRTSITARLRSGAHGFITFLLSDAGRRTIEYSPVLLVVLLTEWLVLTDRASFAQTLSFCGVIAVPIFAGIFPCLLLVSSRRKGDIVPGVVSRLLGQPWLVITVYVLFLLGILLHGLFIWDQFIERAAALLAGITMVLVTVLAIRRGAFDRRTVLMLREDQRPGGVSAFEVVSAGRPVETDVQLEYRDGTKRVRSAIVETPNLDTLRQITTVLPEGDSEDIKVWANRITPEGDVESLPARLRLTGNGQHEEIDLRLAGGMTLISTPGAPGSISLTLETASSVSQPSAAPSRRERSTAVDMHALLDSVADQESLPAKGDTS